MTVNVGKALYKMVNLEKEVKLLKGDKTLATGKVSVHKEEAQVGVGSKKVSQKSVIAVGRDWIRVKE